MGGANEGRARGGVVIPDHCSACGVLAPHAHSVLIQVHATGRELFFLRYCITTAGREGCWPAVFAAMRAVEAARSPRLPCESEGGDGR